MSEDTTRYKVSIVNENGGTINFIYADREKAEAQFQTRYDDEHNVHGLFGTIDEDGEWDGIIDEFDRRPEAA